MKKLFNKIKNTFSIFNKAVKETTRKFKNFVVLNLHTITLLFGLSLVLLAIFLVHYIAGIFFAGVALIFIAFLLNK